MIMEGPYRRMFTKCCTEAWEEKKIWNFAAKEMHIGAYYDIKSEFRLFGHFISETFWGEFYHYLSFSSTQSKAGGHAIE